jgi:DNA polymerase (family 10)
VAIELNASPYRLDIDWRWGELMRKHGVRTSINPDAHTLEGIDDIQYGVGIARKAGFSAGDVLNTMSAAEFGAWLARRKG